MKTLILSHNAVKTFSQLRRLVAFTAGPSSSSPSISELCILPDGNPVVTLQLFRLYCAFALPKLEVLNGEKVTAGERTRGHMYFAQLHRASAENGGRTVASALKAGGAGASLFFGGGSGALPAAAEKHQREALKVAKSVDDFVEGCVDAALETDRLEQEFENCWPRIINSIVAESVKEVNDAAYLENCLDNL